MEGVKRLMGFEGIVGKGKAEMVLVVMLGMVVVERVMMEKVAREGVVLMAKEGMVAEAKGSRILRSSVTLLIAHSHVHTR